MTLGERIAQKRKAAGLSQEALGEIIGVSRQAIYKWESDQAVPELDKLIQLSKVFEISVGWLVSEEEPGAVQKEAWSASGISNQADDAANNFAPGLSAEDAEELTLRVLRDYTAQMERAAANRKQPQKYKWLVAVLCLALLVGVVQLRNLKQQYQNLYNYMSRMEIRTQQEIGNISGNVQRVLEKYSDLTVSSDVKIVSADYASNTVRIEISTKPKTYTKGMTAVFHINTGEEMLNVSASETEDKSFEAAVDCPLTNEISVDVEFVTGDVSESKHLVDYTGLYDMSFGIWDICFNVDFETRNGVMEKYCTVMYYPEKSYYLDFEQGPADFAKLEMCLCEDNRKIADYTYVEGVPEDVTVGTSDGSPMPEYPKEFWFRRPEGLKVDTGKHEYRQVLTVTDVYGRILTVEN